MKESASTIAREISPRMLVLACTWLFRLLVRLARLSRERPRFSESAVRLALALVRAVSALPSALSSRRLTLVGSSHSPNAPGWFNCAVSVATLLTAGRVSRATRFQFELRLALL